MWETLQGGGRGLLLGVLVMLVSAPPGSAQSEFDGYAKARLELHGEYDSNVNLGSGLPGDKAEDDFVWRLRPELELQRATETSVLEFELDGSLRRGVDTPLDDWNLRLRGMAGWDATNGFGTRLTYAYRRTSFDQALLVTDPDLVEPGTSGSERHTVRVRAYYTPVERLSFSAGYAYWTEDVQFGAPGAGDERDVNDFRGRVVVPVTRESSVYAVARYLDQDSKRREEYVYDEQRYVGGYKWEGPHRFTIWAEAGYGSIDFADTPGTDFDNFIGEVGVDVVLSEQSSLSGAVGRGVHGRWNYSIMAQHEQDDGQLLSGEIRRRTNTSYSRLTVSRLFTTTLFRVQWRKPFYERFTFLGEVSYLIFESGVLELRDDRTTLVEPQLEYAIRDWLLFGGSYRYASKNSDFRGFSEFSDQRAGLFVALVY